MTFKKTFRKGDSVQHVEESLCRGTFVRYTEGGALVDFGGDGGRAVVKLSEIKHGPVTVIGGSPIAKPGACPECGGAIEVQTRVEVSEPPREGETERRRRIARAVEFCNGCEYAKEVRRDS